MVVILDGNQRHLFARYAPERLLAGRCSSTEHRDVEIHEQAPILATLATPTEPLFYLGKFRNVHRRVERA